MRSKIEDFWDKFISLIKRREIGVLPGHLAFFFVLSIVPIISIISFLATYLNLPVESITNFLENSFSTEVANMLSPILSNEYVSFQSIFIIFMAFFLASNGANSIILASNLVFNIPSSNYFKRRLKAVFITLILILLFLFIILVPVFGDTILKILGLIKKENAFITIFKSVYPILNLPISMFIIFILIKSIYTLAPDETIPSKFVNKGAIFTTICWLIITSVYSFYINNFVDYGMYYGGLSNIVILMFWFYLMALIFVIGLVLNHRNMEEQIEKTNTLKLNEIKDKIKKSKNKVS